MFLTITLIVTAVAAIYLYLTWNYNYWKKLNVPGPSPLPGLGSFPSFITQRRPVADEMDEIYREYKPKYNFVGVFSNRSPRIMITSSELAKDILSKNFKNFHDNEFGEMTNKEIDPLFGRNPFMLTGDEWKAKRAEITPAFTTSRMKALFPLVEDVCSRMTKYVTQNRGSVLDSKELSAKFTTDVVSSCIFACDAQSFTSGKPEIREQGRKLMEQSFSSFLILLFIINFPTLAKIFKIGLVPKSLEKFFTDLMKEAISHRDASGTNRVDYLDYLISLRNKKEISELDMAAHGVTFFIDGFETSSVAISFMLYEIAKNPEVQKRLRKELQKVTTDQGTVSYDSLLELSYLDQVVNESLRLWPPAAFISKKCTEPMDLPLTANQNVTIGKEICAIINIWSLHRDPEYYDDPLTFNPDRFSPETGGTAPYREKGCFIPFGDGPRQCLGMRFARMQVKRCLYELVSNFKITVNEKTKQPMKLDPKQFLTMPLGGIWLDFEPISK
ncbi:AAEL006992-PA [Aedes aegypti]|uniref:AAEL006992-PA n=2 Tax=Aedes aegypti TaxID=7159 RepID=A0A1S4FF88_AEDAE|nr:probable cytochrome P450 28a5 [Aedes aegypti]EAT41341.1 AAEL006992-PA [Aedes aegypti]